ncbi:hypothetical protein BJY01DRAFT_254439 [Aspergillus pseudoustus]|uniref:Xylanolytic transcriptional activator regulatory domain-containing protein n=1 Tax=Aspergillus pseudoustus TaxID=1810923 RepID=A0ABR4IVU6_9EURO
MYYGIILNTGELPSLKEKLQQNLWLALSDVDVLLRPSEANLQAILLVLSQVSEIAGPSICWMLATSACRMLQALGLDVRLLDQQTRERRVMQFWHLNLLDKGLAIIFAKAPTFHQEEAREIKLPTLEQIQPPRAHLVANGTSGFFGAHYVYQKFLLSRLMADIWHGISGKAAPNCDGTEATLNNLVSWYDQARKILGAAALSEKPFCDAQNAKSINVALHTIEFHFTHLKILLTRSAACMEDTCLDASIRMLHLLQDMAPESNEPYHPILWQLVCCPFTPLLIIFCDIASNNTTASRTLDQKKSALAAMEQLPIFLQGISRRSSLATKLERIASSFVQHARSVISRLDAAVIPEAETTTVSLPAGDPPSNAGEYNSSGVLDSDLLDWSSFHASAAASASPVSTTHLENDFAIFTRNIDSDGMFDWLNWEASC